MNLFPLSKKSWIVKRALEPWSLTTLYNTHIHSNVLDGALASQWVLIFLSIGCLSLKYDGSLGRKHVQIFFQVVLNLGRQVIEMPKVCLYQSSAHGVHYNPSHRFHWIICLQLQGLPWSINTSPVTFSHFAAVVPSPKHYYSDSVKLCAIMWMVMKWW